MVEFLIEWNFTNTCPLLLSEICLDKFGTKYVRWTCFCNEIWQCWSRKYNIHHFCIWFRLFCFSIVIFSCKNMCIVHISLRRYPSISPSKAGDKYSWSCMFVIFSTVSCSDVHGRFTFYCSKTQVATIRFLYFSLLINNIRTGFSSFPRFRIGRN